MSIAYIETARFPSQFAAVEWSAAASSPELAVYRLLSEDWPPAGRGCDYIAVSRSSQAVYSYSPQQPDQLGEPVDHLLSIGPLAWV